MLCFFFFFRFNSVPPGRTAPLANFPPMRGPVNMPPQVVQQQQQQPPILNTIPNPNMAGRPPLAQLPMMMMPIHQQVLQQQYQMQQMLQQQLKPQVAPYQPLQELQEKQLLDNIQPTPQTSEKQPPQAKHRQQQQQQQKQQTTEKAATRTEDPFAEKWGQNYSTTQKQSANTNTVGVESRNIASLNKTNPLILNEDDDLQFMKGIVDTSTAYPDEEDESIMDEVI